MTSLRLPPSVTLLLIGKYEVSSFVGVLLPLISVKYIDGLSVPLVGAAINTTLEPSGPSTGLQLDNDPVGTISTIDWLETVASAQTISPSEWLTVRNWSSLTQFVGRAFFSHPQD